MVNPPRSHKEWYDTWVYFTLGMLSLVVSMALRISRAGSVKGDSSLSGGSWVRLNTRPPGSTAERGRTGSSESVRMKVMPH